MWTWRVAPDHPPYRVACGDGSCADELLAGLERDVSDLSDRRIDLVERTLRPGIDLHRIDKSITHRLDAGRLVGLVDARRRVGRLGRASRLRHALQLAG